jgi:ribosomal-protein-alanine N-acetyltransferase
MMLEVDVTNESAISLYKNLGYETLNVRKNYYGYGRDAQIMRRGL